MNTFPQRQLAWRSLLVLSMFGIVQLGMIAPAYAGRSSNMRRLLATRECQGCDLENADFNRQNLAGVNLQDANIRFADFRRANLENANLSNADMLGAFFNGATLCNTTMPNGTVSNRNCADPEDRENDQDAETP